MVVQLWLGCHQAVNISIFYFYSDITNISTARIVRKNPVEAMLDTSQDNSFVNRWGGELKGITLM